MLRRCLVAALLLSLAACKSETEKKKPDFSQELPPGEMALVKITDPKMIPDFGKGFGDREALLRSIDESMGWFQKASSGKHYPYLDVDHDRALASLVVFRDVVERAQTPEDLNTEVRSRFDVYVSKGVKEAPFTVLFTGYCEPIFEGSLTRDSIYRYPLYRRPKDLVSDPDGTPRGRQTKNGNVPYWTRDEIESAHLLDGQGLELVYLKDKFEAYICQVQGSARILLSDGRELRVGYAGKTDRPYQSVGQNLIKTGRIKKEELSLKRLKQYFKEHPEEVDADLAVNESYVFFTERQGGPFGSLGVTVTPYHTIATDKEVFPRGCIAYLQTTLPRKSGDGIAPAPFSGFAMDQDTGGAIRSAGRTDIFMGTGPDAELLAGSTYYEGKLYYVFLKDTEPRPQLPTVPKAVGATQGRDSSAPASIAPKGGKHK